MKYLIFNLKSKFTRLDIIEYANNLLNIKNDIIVCPSNIYLDYFRQMNFKTCAQDVSKYPIGNYTGETSATALKSIGVSYVLIGHYERRFYFNEQKEDFIAKTKQVIKRKMKAIYCIGNNNDDNFPFLKKEVRELFDNLTEEERKNIIIAYEPIWLIGTNKQIDLNRINSVIIKLKDFVYECYKTNIEIIYGGSVNSSSAALVKNMPVDGLLIGDSSTSTDEIHALCRYFKQ